MNTRTTVAIVLGLVAMPLYAQGGRAPRQFNVDPVLVAWLEETAKETVANARRMSTSEDRVPYYPPCHGGRSEVYTHFFLSDLSLLAEGSGLVSIADLKESVRWYLRRQGDDGRIPQAIAPDGETIHWGANESGTDMAQWAVFLVYEICRAEAKPAFFEEVEGPLRKAMDWVERTDDGLVFSGGKAKGHTWLDSIIPRLQKKRKLCWSSIMYWKAALHMAEMYSQLRMNEFAADFTRRASLTRESIRVLWWDEEGIWRFSSGSDRHFVVPNAYAVYVGFTTGQEADLISRWIRHNYQGLVKKGWVRHLLYPEGWSGDARGEYMDGGYWFIWVGWVAYAIWRVDEDLAVAMVEDAIREMQENGAAECRHANWSSRNVDFITGFGPALAAIYRMQEESG